MARGKSKQSASKSRHGPGRVHKKGHKHRPKEKLYRRRKSPISQESQKVNEFGTSLSSDVTGQNNVFMKGRKILDGTSMTHANDESSGEDNVESQTNKCYHDPYALLLSTFTKFDSNLQQMAIESDDESEDDGGLGLDLHKHRPRATDSSEDDECEDKSKRGHKRRLVDTNRHTKVLDLGLHIDDEENCRPRPRTSRLTIDKAMSEPHTDLGQTLKKYDNLQLSENSTKRQPGATDIGIAKDADIRAVRLKTKQTRVEDCHPSTVNGQSSSPIEDAFEVNVAKDYGDESSDPFALHFYYDMDNSLYEGISKEPLQVETCHQNWPVIGHFLIQLPKPSTSELTVKIPCTKMAIIEEKRFAEPGSIPKTSTSSTWFHLYIKSQISKNIFKANTCYTSRNGDSLSPLSPLQRELFSLICNYQDVYFPYRTLSNGEEVRFVYCLHAVNHILKTRSKIIHHNAKLAKKDEVPEEFRDQGLVRPKVVILVPFREAALRVVKMIIAILFQEEKGNVMHMKRFVEEYSGEEISMPKKNPRPEDYEAIFVGNTDDTFRIGMTVTRKSLKLYADFYSADIIVASPLGLRMVVGAEGEAERDFDFLASIELLVMDQTEIFLMQNWDHLLHVLDHFHLQPKESHGTDFSRVRSWAINGWTQYYRQTLLFSSLSLPEISALFNKKCRNYAGKIKVVNPISTGTICQVVVQLPQVFYRFDATSATQSIDARLDFFTKKILPQFKDSIMSHTMVYLPSYFDFVCLRNYFKREDMSFVQICEYSKEGKVARARDMFFHTEAHFLLYSERCHFFRRFRIKGIRHLIFYQPPTFPHLYNEMCNLMHEANQSKMTGNESNMTVTVLYSKYDVQQLAALVGTDRAKKMVASERSVHMFMTGE